MTKPDQTAKAVIVVNQDLDRDGKLKHLGGSQSDTFNNVLANSVVNTLWAKVTDPKDRESLCSAAVAALIGIGPQDELEGMLAGRLVAANAAAMECYRRAMLSEQTFEGRKENLTQANKLSRTYAALLEALNRHRGKGIQQKVTVEHVTSTRVLRPSWELFRRGEGHRAEMKGNLMHKPLPMHQSPRCGAKTRSGKPCQSPAMPNGRCRMHGGASPGAPRGERNGNYRHGRFTCEAMRERRALNVMIRAARRISEAV